MHAAGELGRQHLVHRAAALDAAEAGEGRRAHHHAEVGLAALAPAAVAAMRLAFVDHLEVVGMEGGGELGVEDLGYAPVG